MQRRKFLTITAAAPFVLRGASLPHKERVDRALKGQDADRVPFTFWHHFGLKTPEEHARRTYEFHRDYRTDIVKVMSDFDYPKPADPAKWWDLKVTTDPFPQQIRALEMIRNSCGGDAYFIETLFNPYNVAEKLSSRAELNRLKAENPQALLDALEVITQSEIHHARKALRTGASGVLLSVANANKALMTPEEYQKFSAPFDQRILTAVSGAKLNILHLHVEPEYLSLFHRFPATAINYSLHVSGIPFATMHKEYPQVMMGGIDELNYRKLPSAELKSQWQAAAQVAGKKFILTPGCSVPNESTREELERLPALLGA